MHPAQARAQMVRAQLALSSGNGTQALLHADRALAILSTVPQKNGRFVYAPALRAAALQSLGQGPAAVQAAQQAVALARETFKDFAHSYWLGLALLQLGQVQRAQGDEAAARQALAEALQQYTGALGGDAPATLVLRGQVAGR